MNDEPRERPVLVSACLLGRRCRYDGRRAEDPTLAAALAERAERAIGFCPEEEGGLGTPRPRAWLEGDAAAVLDGRGKVVDEHGADVTEAFVRGARGALAACREHGITRAYLKERSPSCGVRVTHVDGEAVEGRGVTAEVLAKGGTG